MSLALACFGLSAVGLLAWICVAADCANGERRWMTPFFWLCVAGAIVWSATSPRDVVGVLPWAAALLRLIVGMSVVLCGFVLAQSTLHKRRRWRSALNDAERLLADSVDWPGFRKSAGCVGLAIVLLVCLELATAASAGAESSRWRAVLVSVCAAGCSVAAFSLAGRKWSRNLAEAGLALMTLAIGAAALIALPGQPSDVASRFPMVFNSLTTAFAVMTLFWVWLGRVWRQQLDDGVAWTAAGGISLLCPSFAFYVGTLGLINATLMSVWPRMASVGVFDDSLGRIAAGVGGHLVLLLVLLRCARVTGRSAFNGLGALVVVSLVVFVLVRADPLRSREHAGPDAADGARGAFPAATVEVMVGAPRGSCFTVPEGVSA